MKKLCLTLASMGLVSSTIINVIACSKGLNTSPNYTDEEKMIGIRNLTQEMLEKNGVKLLNGFNIEDELDLLKALELDKLLEESEGNPADNFSFLLRSSFKIYVMANSLLNEISSKVPGFGWIANKLTWQSQWALKDLIEKGQEGGSNNVSGWMMRENDWSLSVTFLNEDKTGWAGVDSPHFARININKKLVATKEGKVCTVDTKEEFGCEEVSNPEAVHYGGNMNSQEAIQNDKVGSIYQGYVSSSRLISLQNIFSDEKQKISPGIINFSPSAADFVNNLIIDFDFINIILANSKDEIEKQFNDYLRNEPFYTSDRLEVSDINIRLKNQLYVVTFAQMLNRRHLKSKDGQNLFSDEELKYSYIWMEKSFEALKITLEELLITSSIINKPASEKIIRDFLNGLPTYREKDKTNEGLSEEEILNFKRDLENVIKVSRDFDDPNSIEYNFAAEQLNMNVFKNPTANPFPNERIGLTSKQQYLDFGYDNSYHFEIQYWGRTQSKETQNLQWYLPDATKNPATDQFMSDEGFKNIFLENRFINNGLLSQYNRIKNSNGSDILYIDPFQFPSNKENIALIMRKKLLEIIKWDSNNNEVTEVNDGDWRIYHLTSLMNFEITKELKNIFALSNGSEFAPKIWEYGISLGNKQKDKRDDDLAFAQLINDNNIPISLVDIQTDRRSEFAEQVYSNGLEWIDNDLLGTSFNLIFGPTNTYGKRYDKTIDFNNWWNQSNRVFSPIKVSIQVSSNYLQSLKEYWKRNITQNQNNPDSNPDSNLS